MNPFCRAFLALTLAGGLIPEVLVSQEQPFRPPAIPLVTRDPYFSIWSFSDHPARDWPRHWTGTVQALCSMVRIDGRVYRVLGKGPEHIPELPLKETEVTPTQTVYYFAGDGIGLSLRFTTPILPDDLDTFSRPVTYLSWQAKSVDKNQHSVSIYFHNSAELVVNTPDQNVAWSRFRVEGLDVLSMGSEDQPVLQKSGDDLRIDWGYFYLASPAAQKGTTSMQTYRESVESFVRTGILPASDDIRMPRRADDEWPVLSFAFDLGTVTADPVGRFLILAYDERYSVEYFKRQLEPYWKANGLTAENLLKRAAAEYEGVCLRCNKFDEELQGDLKRIGGERYARLASLAYRQAMAAHTLAADVDGTPLLFPKENFSNGCISTVDVIYPTAPVFLLFNVDLLKATVRPVLQYAGMKRWRFPFAPHDLGTYPLANGQVYGGGEKTEEDQMPVEECGNLLILVYAIAKADGSADFATTYWRSLEQWARYLREKGLDPENQLCTDDFAGHLAHNVNLSLKAILALGSYSKLCGMAGKPEEANEYWKTSQDFARRWEQMAADGDHYRLAFDKPGTWSQKYNLVWDTILDLNLFPATVARKEIQFYRKNQNRFGLSLDDRRDYTKLDWEVWTATLAEKRSDFEGLISAVYDFANQTPDRVPLTDWYDIKTGRHVGFQARSVVGGVFIKLLKDDEVWRKWSSRGKQ